MPDPSGRVLRRLADYHVTLSCPADLTEEQLDTLCLLLEQLDFRSKIESWLAWYVRNRRVLRGVTVCVEE